MFPEYAFYALLAGLGAWGMKTIVDHAGKIKVLETRTDRVEKDVDAAHIKIRGLEERKATCGP